MTKIRIIGVSKQRQAAAVDTLLDRHNVTSLSVAPNTEVITVEGDLDVGKVKEDFPADTVEEFLSERPERRLEAAERRQVGPSQESVAGCVLTPDDSMHC